MAWKRAGKHSIKKQWYVLYFAVLIIPILVMLFSYRLSYARLAEAVYEGQMAHLTLVREIVDTEARNMSSVMLSFGSDQQIREAINIQNPTEENRMDLLRSLIFSVNNASVNNDLVDHYALYLPESNYLLDDAHWDPRRVLAWKGYDGVISEKELADVLSSAQPSRLNLIVNRNGSLILFTKVNVYKANKPLYVAAILSGKELTRLISSGTAGDEALIALVSLDGEPVFSNDENRNAAYLAHPSGWFHAEVESEVLPLRYLYASPTNVVEGKLISYRYALFAFLAAALILGIIAIIAAVHRQYTPVARLMQHFTDSPESLKNEYGNISDYLLHAQERNDHHFMTDLLLGNVSDYASFPYQQLVLISPLDAKALLHIDPAEAERAMGEVRVISVYEHTVLIFQQRTWSETQLREKLTSLVDCKQTYMIYTLNEGLSLHEAYAGAEDMLTALRFFKADAGTIYHVSHAGREQTLMLMDSSFEENMLSAVLSRNQEKAWLLMGEALGNMREKCHSGTLLRGSLYAVSHLFMRLEASVRSQNTAVPDGVAGDAVKAYRFSSIDQLEEGSRQALHDLIMALDMQKDKKAVTLFDQIDTFIRQNYQHPDLNVDMIADHLNFSVVYLRRVYKQGSGSSISDAILKLRIEKAKQALLVHSSRVNDVSQQVGFLDTGTFIRSFKKLEGMTPGAYKSQFQEMEAIDQHDQEERS